MTNEEKLLKELILIPSFSGSEKTIGEYLFNILKDEGFKVEKYSVDKKRFNIVAKFGYPNVYLSAHMDTVTPMLKYRETDSHIFGRGACDTKASIAAMITAAIVAKKQGVTNFGLIFTVGEETVLDGVKTIIKSKLKVPFVVVGEPTSLKMVNGHFGILVVKITAKGKAAHSSQPKKGINAIDILLAAVRKIKTISIYPETLISLVQIKGGVADNIIPSDSHAIFSFRISPYDHIDYVESMKPLLSKNVGITTIQKVEAVYSKVPTQLSFIKSSRTVKYLTELSFYKNGIVLGPGDIQFAHGTDEKLPRKELAEAVKIYTKILRNFSE